VEIVLEIEVPYPPSINHYYRRVGPKTLISRKGRKYRETLAHLLSATGVEQVEGRIFLEIEMYPPDRRRRDVDNVLKALLDAMQHGGAYEDDSQVDSLWIIRRQPVEGGRLIVRFLKK